MKVLVISATTERECFSGNLPACLIESKRVRGSTKLAVVVESNRGKRLSMAEQDRIIARLKTGAATCNAFLN